MSDHRAIAVTTEVIRQVLQTHVSVDVNGANATAVRPDTSNGGALPDPGVNVFLYHVTPNPALRNMSLPNRNASGALTSKPILALNLHYLLTFHGSDAEYFPQRVMGSALSALHDEPCLSRDRVQAIVDAAAINDPNGFLATSDLARQIEIVRLTPEYLNLDDLTKLWSIFFQTAYCLSANLVASVVLIEGPSIPSSPLPVLTPFVGVIAKRAPNIRALTPPIIPFAASAPVAIVGEDLFDETTTATVGGIPAVISAGATALRVEIQLPADVPYGVRAVFLQTAEPLDAPHITGKSAAAFLAVQPVLNAVTYLSGGNDPRIRVTTNREVNPEQRTFLILNEFATPVPENPRTYRIPVRPLAAAGTSLLFDAADVAVATYLVRLEVDSVESNLTVDTNPVSPTFNRYISPTVDRT